MISIKCPHCKVGLKVNEGKLPLGITSFKCPNCKQPIPISLVEGRKEDGSESETVLLHPASKEAGRLTVVSDGETPQQVLDLHEGIHIIGRLSKDSPATLPIRTTDRLMSRAHIRIEVRKDSKGGYKHLLSDNNSKNHTLYNQSYLDKDEVVVLKDGDEILIGRTLLRFNG